MSFGKRRTPPGAAASTGSGASTDGGTGGGQIPPAGGDAAFPWADDPSAIACNLACGSLASSIILWVKDTNGRVHAETYVAAAGAIAGYAAQQSLMASGPAQLQMVQTKSGEEYLFGDALNNMLLPSAEAAYGRVWAHAAGAAVAAGTAETKLPNCEAMFRHVSEVLGGPMEGRPSTGDAHQPAAPARQLLAHLWPLALTVLKGEIDGVHRQFGPAPQKWWGAIAAYGSGRPIGEVKEVLDPAIALTILMETAIYTSKLTKF